jgi:hypothetical protein
MGSITRPWFLHRFLAYAQGLRFPTLFAFTAALFLFDLMIPDFVPFVDELLLGGLTVLFGTWKQARVARREAAAVQSADVDVTRRY